MQLTRCEADMPELDVQKIKERDEQALRQLFDELHPRLALLAHRYGMTTPDVEDVLQAALVKIFTNLDKAPATDSQKFRTWCYVVMRNVMFDNFRRLRMREMREMEHERFEASLSEIQPETLRVQDQLKSEIEKLPENDRNLLMLRMDGNSLAEIAEKTGKSKAHIARQYNRVVKQLRERLEPYLG
jgi:RNA polymerase sigma factor (sigma-70 family)